MIKALLNARWSGGITLEGFDPQDQMRQLSGSFQ
jgi:hypothetical protein